MPSQQQMFEQILALQGKRVEVALESRPEKLEGVITNTMFDSFLLESKGKPHVIAFNDLLYLDELKA